MGRDGASAIGTVVERVTRYVMLLHLPEGRGTEDVRDALGNYVTPALGNIVTVHSWSGP